MSEEQLHPTVERVATVVGLLLGGCFAAIGVLWFFAWLGISRDLLIFSAGFMASGLWSKIWGVLVDD